MKLMKILFNYCVTVFPVYSICTFFVHDENLKAMDKHDKIVDIK